MTFGAKILATLRALGLFVGVWGVLAGVAWAAGILPGTRAEIDGASTEEALLEEGPVNDELDAPPEVSLDTETEDVTPAPVPVPVEGELVSPDIASLVSPLATSVALRVCDDSLAPVSITAGQLLGDETPELIVSCGAEVNVLGRSGAGVMRVAQVRDASSTPARAATVALVDLGGDGRDDLLIGFIGAAENASASRLVLVPSNERGGLEEPQVLAPISAVSMTGAELDGRPGTDLVALHQADGFGRRPSEAWVIAGGPSPVRTARQILHAGGRAVAALDLDGDTHVDLLSADSAGIFHYAGDGAGRLAAGTKFADVVATHLAVRSREDERHIAWAVGTELTLRFGDAAPESEDVGAELRGVAFDESAGLLVLLAQSWLRYEPEGANIGDGVRTLLPARLDALAFCVWADEVVVLARSETAIELLRLPLEGGGEVDEGVAAGALIDAPLSLRVDIQ